MASTMKPAPYRDEHHWGLWARIGFGLQHFCVLAICGVLVGALWVQFGQGEFPCPLCLQQRMAMMMAAIGSMFVIAHGRYARVEGFSVMGVGYGISILSAALGMLISARQVLLHIMPDDAGYGSPVFGLHLYTWALVVFMVVIIVSGLMLIFGREAPVHSPEESGDSSKSSDGKRRIHTRLGWYSWTVFGILATIISINIVATFFEAGFNMFLPDNPDSYILMDGKEPSGKTPAAK